MRLTCAPWTSTAIVPRMILPFAVLGILKTHVAIPLATTCELATIRLPARLAAQSTVPLAIGPFVSFSVTAIETENARPAFAGFGEVVNAVTAQHELRQHLVGVEAVARVGRDVAVDVGEVEIAGRGDRDAGERRARRTSSPSSCRGRPR